MNYRELDLIWRALISGGLFLATLGLCLWIYWASNPGQRSALVWRILSTATVVLTLPSLIISAFQLDVEAQVYINPLFYLSLVGAMFTVIATVGFAVTARGQEEVVIEPRPWPPIGVGETPSVWPPRGETPSNDWVIPPDARERESSGANPTVAGDGAPAGGRGGRPQGTVIINPPQGPGGLAYLVERNGPRAGRPHLLGERTQIGRASDCGVRLDDPTVTERHASVQLQPNGVWLLKDLDSANGTFIVNRNANGEEILARVDQYQLAEPDIIRLGECDLIFMAVGPEPAGSPEAEPVPITSATIDGKTVPLRMPERDQNPR